jgi:hypothetical protein
LINQPLLSTFVSTKIKYHIKKITIMKKSLLIALCCSFFLVSFVSAKTHTEADIALKAGIDRSVRPTSVTSSVNPVTASVDGDLVNVNFSSALGATTITIENSYGEVIYETSVNVQGSFTMPISLAGAGSDTYLIQIKTATKKWYGEFDL